MPDNKDALNTGGVKATDVFKCEITGAVLVLLASFNRKHDGNHSLQYTLEDALITGLKAKIRSIEYSEETKTSRLFKAAISKDPAIVTRPAEFAALCRKYGVGCTPVEMTSMDERNAAQPPAPAEAEKVA
jgi:hypothetical protein